VINNRRIQEFAFPIAVDEGDTNPVAVIAFERDVYVTRNILGRHWDFMADNLIKALKEKIKDGTSFPSIAFGEGALIIQEIVNQDGQRQKKIFFANPLAVHLLSELAEHAYQLIGRLLDDLFANFTRKSRGSNELQSISLIEEITLRQRTIVLRHVVLSGEMSVVLIRDNSEIKIKETLLKEIHHRVKNNLQTIISLLSLQKRRNPELEEAFDEAINRANSIALVHEYLAHSTDIENIDFGFLVQKLLKGLLTSFGADNIIVDFDCPKKVFIVSEEATNLALVLNEILTNTLGHTAAKLSRIDIKLYKDDGKIHLTFEDDGGGFKDGFDYKQSTGLGWEIVRTIAEESLKGKLSVENVEKDGRRGIKVHLAMPDSTKL
jgi:two-component sensor histidine kinase